MQSIGTKVLPLLLRRFRSDWRTSNSRPRRRTPTPTSTHGVESGAFDLSFSPCRSARDRCRTPGDGRPVRLPGAGRGAGGPSGSVSLRQAAPAAADRLLRPRPRRRAGPPAAPHRQRAHFVFRSNDNPTIQGFVAAGLGYAVMPRLTVDETTRRSWCADRRRPFRATARRRLARRPAVAATATRFIELAVDVCADLSQGWADTRQREVSQLASAADRERGQRARAVARSAAELDLTGHHRRVRRAAAAASPYQRQGRLAVLAQVAGQPTQEVLDPGPAYDDGVGEQPALAGRADQLGREDAGADERPVAPQLEAAAADPAVAGDVVDRYVGGPVAADRLQCLPGHPRRPRTAGRPSRRCRGWGVAARSGRSPFL